MRSILLLPFIFIFSCATPVDQGYLITDYNSSGKVENTYFVKAYHIGVDDVSFISDNKIKTVTGSFKIEKISKK